MSLRLSGLISGMDTESMVKELMKAQNLKKTKIENKITTAEWKQDKWKTLNAKIYAFYTGALSKLKMQGSFNTKMATSSNESKVAVSASITAPDGTHTLKIAKLASAQFVTGAKLGTDINSKPITADTKLVDLGMVADDANQITVTAGTTAKTLTITDTTTVADMTKALKDAGLNATYDTTQNRFFISSKTSGYANAFSISTSGSVNLSKLGLSTITKTSNPDGSVTVAGGSNITLIEPSDAKIIYNGAEITNSTNNISINGLNLTLKSVTGGMNTPSDTTDDEVISIGVEKNTQATYDMVKDFVKKYNELLTEMNADYNAASAKGYDPLTDEQKEAMTDDQITKWEDKIKDSLLRRDSSLSSIITSMRSEMNGFVEFKGKNYSLSSIGIETGNYTEKGLLHINGDADDSMTSGLENTLMKTINEEPDKVMSLLNGLADKLYTSLTDSMKGNSLRSALTVYNDKEITKQVTNYKEDLKELEKKLQNIESRYYKQFTAMESAMAKLNSQSSSLAGMLGNS
jgi:flagellar hook-associated protein 2